MRLLPGIMHTALTWQSVGQHKSGMKLRGDSQVCKVDGYLGNVRVQDSTHAMPRHHESCMFAAGFLAVLADRATYLTCPVPAFNRLDRSTHGPCASNP